jgi:DNA mismatch repair protein MutL
MGKINILDDHIANQIAAGEVVERPSSVVKELVENAVDASSTRVDVTVEEGGLNLIRVVDNGSGMAAEDSEMAFARHATSKIVTGKDLFQIRTLGFRGEALPSIAAVAKVELVTSERTDGLGRRVVIEGGRLLEAEETAASRGTDIRVKELFYNTPARLKYMKTIQTELGHISDFLYRLAMAHPGIAFTLKHNGHNLLQTLGNGDLLGIIAAVYGTAAAKSMVAVSGEDLDYRISGYVSKPETTRTGRAALTLVVNGRYVRSYSVTQAVLKAYHTLLPVNRYPVGAIHLEMEPSLVDVNVHPAKLEVRFSKENELLALAEQSVRTALLAESLIPRGGQKTSVGKTAVVQEQMALYRPGAEQGVGQGVEQGVEQGAPLPTAPPKEEAGGARFSGGDKKGVAGMAGDNGRQAGGGSSAASSAAAQLQGQWTRSPETDGGADSVPSGNGWIGGDRRPLNSSMQSGTSGSPRTPGNGLAGGGRPSASSPRLSAEQLARIIARPELEPQTASVFPALDPVGQLHGTYLVAQSIDGMYLIDQHAAHERINYEHYRRMFAAPTDASQELLIPLTLEFTATEALALAARLPLLEQAGVYLEPFGGSSYLLRAYPHWLPKDEEQAIVQEMIEWVLTERKAIDIGQLRNAAAAMCSCKASIKANQNITKAEMEALLDRLAACRNPYTCPHGRPVLVSFTTRDLEKMFKRIM